MKFLCHLLAFGFLAWVPHAHAQELNVLVIGSTHSFSEGGEHDVVHEKPFNPTAIATHLEAILSQDPLITDSVNVVFEDVYKSKTNTVRTSNTGIDAITARCYSLAQHFMWPDGKATRLANLRSEAGTKWDYIVLCGDPYIMANFPGMHAEGVKLIQSEVAKTVVPQGQQAPAVVLLAQWPENSSTFSAEDFNEVAHRIGGSSGLAVVPAGKVWNSYTSQDTSAAHPTPKGEYLAAASIYSKLYNRSASTSGYDYTPGGDAIADHALSVVQATAAAPQYSGTYTTINPFQMKYVSKRTVSFRETGTSTEDRLADALHRLDDVCRMRFIQNQGTFWDFNYGRGNDRWEDDKDYEVNPAKHDRAYGFPMHHYYTGSAADAAAQTMPYGIDKYYYGSSYEDGTDLGIAYNMIRPNTRELSLPQDVRAIPIRLLWMKMERAFPGFQPLGDNTHMGPYLNDASAAFIYTLLSGRCPVVSEPTPVGSAAWQQWLGHKTGYETAWQMSHLTTRAPGFRVLPSHVDATTVTSTAGETMTVRFMNQPQSNVTVSIASSNPGVATVSPSTLTFTPANHATPQNITVSGVAAGTGLQNFNVLITTSSSDEIYNGLADSWAYVSNTDSVSYGQTVLLVGFDGTNSANTTSGTAGVYKELTAPHKSSTSSANVNATFSTTDAVANGLQWVGSMTSPSTWGSATYTPNATTTNTGVFVADNAITCSLLVQNTGINQVTLEKLHFRLHRESATGGAANQAAITLASGNLTASGPGEQLLSASSGAFNYDFDLSTILTDATLAPNESATFTLSFVPADAAGTNRRIRVDNLAFAGKVIQSVADTVAPTPNPMTWASVPAAVSSSSITMTATMASDPSGVEYFFDETSGNPGGSDSGWQNSATYTDSGLQANTNYTYTVTARDKAATPNPTVASASGSATTHAAANPVSAGTSTVVASPASVPANNSTTSTITVTLQDAGGAPVSGRTVSLVGNGSATIQTANNTSNASGVVTFTVKSGTVGTVTFSATGDSVAITQTANVQFTAVVPPPSAGEITWSVHNITGNASEVSNAGTTVIAASGADGGVTANVVDGTVWATVNGVSFTDNFTMDSPSNLDTLNSRASASVSGEYYKMLQFADRQSSGLATWTFNGLTIGNTYQIQIWAQDNVSTAGTIGHVLNKGGINTPVLNTAGHALILVEASGEGSSGQYALGTFVANATTQQFQARAYSNLTTTPSTAANITINAYQLRDLGAVANTFASWISEFNLGEQTGFTDDFDKDGLANGIENYFGTHPGAFTDGVLPGVANTGAGTFTFTHPLNNSPASDVSAVYRWSKNLSTFHLSGQSDPSGTTVTFTQGTSSNGRVPVTATITGTAAERIFFDIKVTKN